MADKFANNRNKYAGAPSAGLAVVNSFAWDVDPSTNGDKVYIGELPAFHKLLPEACSLIADGNTDAMNIDLVLEDVDDGNSTLVDNVAVTADTWSRTGFSTYQACHEAGAKPVNRRIYLLLNTAPDEAGGQVVANIACYPVG